MAAEYKLDGFLSTPSGWRATHRDNHRRVRPDHFYPRPPGGGRRFLGAFATQEEGISIHALRVEGDPRGEHCIQISFKISIHALRVEGDTEIDYVLNCMQRISIHALRVEGD